MNEAREIAWGRCVFCGRFFRKLTGDRCQDCGKEIESYQNSKGERTEGWTPRFYIVEEPDPVGGFPVGAGFDLLNFERTLARGHYTPGAVIEDRKAGVRLRVQQNASGRGQVAVEIGA